MTASMRSLVQREIGQLRDAVPMNAGLLLDFGSDLKGDTGEVSQHIKMISRVSPGVIYSRTFERWKAQLALHPHAATQQINLRDRMSVGLGGASVWETGITLQRNSGVPYIPGAALKGLARAFLRTWLKQNPDEGGQWDAVLLSLFGEQECAGGIVWHDAWYVPGTAPTDQPLQLDVITVHHPEYYRTMGKKPATDFDDPNPVSFLSARGAYLFAVDSSDADWSALALSVLATALSDWGIGAKTSSGYGRFEKIDVAVSEDVSKQTANSDPISVEQHPRVVQARLANAGNLEAVAQLLRDEPDAVKYAVYSLLLDKYKPNKKAIAQGDRPWVLEARAFIAAADELE